MPEIIFLWLGLLCLGYFVGIARYVGWTSKFPIVWAGLGAGLLLTGILILTENLSKKAELLCCAMGILLLVSVVVVVAVIASVMFLPVEPDLDYLVVLGAQVMGTRPSLSLQYRIDSACEYLKENPGTRAVLSGGKGPDEGISEARCMYEEMLRQGVDREQLILEDRSASTSQNIEFTRNLLKEKTEREEGTEGRARRLKVGIVTNGFHLFRGMAIARKKTDWQVYGIGAKSNAFLLPNYLFREFFCVIKDKLVGNL
ncbi:YdcF family protein [Blautia sp. An81]|uniref:YdcF family protein n=1 Tax=Blautia sp. An81 TaxID=1965659 RepID=UPI000B38FE16|nr:YdcF family protein [Blautia sp. An81]OUN31026.1 hypothetical protein B5G33_05540 [Blautia sp. An81]